MPKSERDLKNKEDALVDLMDYFWEKRPPSGVVYDKYKVYYIWYFYTDKVVNC